jgi:hypothetical protein
MMLSRVDRENEDDGMRAFDCVACDHHGSVILRYRQAASASIK